MSETEFLPTEKNIKDYELLRDLLNSQRVEFDLLSKKKTDGQLNPMKIKMLNRVLEPLKELFVNEQSYKFLDTVSEDDMPTNSDVVLIISQFETAISEFKNRYFRNDKYVRIGYGRTARWMTKECPPEFNANRKGYELDSRYRT